MKNRTQGIALIILSLILLTIAVTCKAQTEWNPYVSKYSGLIITIQDMGNCMVKTGIKGTTASTYTSLSKTVTIPDPKLSADYIALNALLAIQIEKVNAANSEIDRLTEANHELNLRLTQAGQAIKYFQKLTEYDTIIPVKFDKRTIKH